MDIFFESGKDTAVKRDGWAALFSSCAKDTVASKPHCPYGYKALENLYLLYIAGDHIHTYITICKEPQQKHRIGMVSDRLLECRRLQLVLLDQNFDLSF